MCEFCIKHGEGKKWYENIYNYSEELFKKLQVGAFIKNSVKRFNTMDKKLKLLEKINKFPFIIKNLLKKITLNVQKRFHYGQVIPIEDVEKVLDLTSSIVRFSCLCRKVMINKIKRCCFGLGILHPEIEEMSKDFDVEILTKQEAIKIIKELEQERLYHSIWTFKTPFIGAICNCDYDCIAYKTTINLNYPTFFKSEYIAEVNIDDCTGCKNCKKLCLFNAIYFSLSMNKCIIDRNLCYGCGICRIACKNFAIRLVERSNYS